MNIKIHKELQSVFQEVFDRDDLEIKAETTAADVEGWDSMVHVQLVLAIEEYFEMRFSNAEIMALENVGDMVGLIERKQSK